MIDPLLTSAGDDGFIMSDTSLISGLLVVDKPSGLTSFQCVHRIKKILGDVRVGHCGTLDPMAQGVLVVLYGAATKLQDEFLVLEKQYWFRARWGIMTDTGDRDGKETARFDFAHVTEGALAAALTRFEGNQLQTPPMYAALKYKGRHYYDWARQGVEIPRSPRPIHITSFDLLTHAGDFWEARVVCSRGTYVRTLAEDVARSFGSGAHLDGLIRERIGPYRREDALTWDTIEQANREFLLQHAQEPLHHHARLV
jgi:tRNA pseudouridine55 synthase